MYVAYFLVGTNQSRRGQLWPPKLRHSPVAWSERNTLNQACVQLQRKGCTDFGEFNASIWFRGRSPSVLTKGIGVLVARVHNLGI